MDGYRRRRHRQPGRGNSTVKVGRVTVSAIVVAAALLSSPARAGAAPGWRVQPTPNPQPGTASALYGVSCTSATACMAVGYSPVAAGLPHTASAEWWNGTSWKLQPVPNPAGSSQTVLDGVSCTTASACTAVGWYASSSGLVTFAERWNGTSWTIQSTPPGGLPANLSSVRCLNATDCLAVGSGWVIGCGPFHCHLLLTLAEIWNGTTWSTLNPISYRLSQLYGVSCVSDTACTTVGRDQYDNPLAESWNGTTWTLQAFSSSLAGPLNGVSCTTLTFCAAVGGSGAEQWNGSSWSVEPTPGSNGLLDVSCTSTLACTAVGFSQAARWDGTAWSIAPTPLPSGANNGVLNSVSCIQASTCFAVGSYTNASGVEVTMAEQYSALDGSSLVRVRGVEPP